MKSEKKKYFICNIVLNQLYFVRKYRYMIALFDRIAAEPFQLHGQVIRFR